MLQNEEILKREPKAGYGFIYLYTFDDGKQYVGQTPHSIMWRHSQHRHKDSYVDAYVKTHDCTLEMVGEVPICELNEKELFYILKYNTYMPLGLNLTLGGDCSNRGYFQDERNKEKMSQSLKRYYSENAVSDEIRMKLSVNKKEYYKTHTIHNKGKPAWNKGKSPSLESRDRISKGLKKYYCGEKSKTTRDKQSKRLKGVPFTKEHSQHIAEAQTIAWARRKAIWYFFKQLDAISLNNQMHINEHV